MQEIALFPLNMFLLPGDYTQLYIFEERYKQLIKHCCAKKQDFGIPFSNKLNTKNLGCLAEVVEVVKEYPGGEMDVLIKATGVFKLEQFFYQLENKLYPGGRVTKFQLENNAVADAVLEKRVKDYLVKYEIYNSELLSKEGLGIYEIANALQMNDMERLDLVNIQTVEGAQSFLLNYLRYLELLHEQEQQVYQNLYLN
jgi:Lon protease-like protein